MKNLKINSIDFRHANPDNWYNILLAEQTGQPGDYEIRIRLRCTGEPDFTQALSSALAIVMQQERKLQSRKDDDADNQDSA